MIFALSVLMPTAELQSSSPTSCQVRLHFGFLDGIRGLAALYVMFSHLFIFQFSISAWSGCAGLLVNWLLYGHLAVDVFIVLSGFCLVIPAVRSGQLPGSAVAFFKKRARRILPPFYAALIFCAAALLALPHVKHASHAFTLPALAINALLLQDAFPNYDYSFNPPFWSVAVEWKIYFLFPPLLFVWKRYSYTGLLGSAAALAVAVTAALHEWRPAMPLGHTCPWYVFLFILGMAAGLLAFSEKGRSHAPKSLWGVLCFLPLLMLLLKLYPITRLGEDAVFVPHLPLIDTAAGALTASLLALLASASGPVSAWGRSVLSLKPLGTFGYSLYLVHFPLISCLDLAAHHLPGLHTSSARQAFLFVAGPPLVIAGAYLFHLVCERPFMTKPAVKTEPERGNSPRVAAVLLITDNATAVFRRESMI